MPKQFKLPLFPSASFEEGMVPLAGKLRVEESAKSIPEEQSEYHGSSKVATAN